MRGKFNVAFGRVERNCKSPILAEQLSDGTSWCLKLGNSLPSNRKS
jgi:hypothetical protein